MATPSTKGILIRIRNAAALAAKGGGWQGDLGGVFASLAPGAASDTVTSIAADKMRGQLQQQGVEADVQVVDTSSLRPVTTAPGVVKYVGVGMLGGSLVGLAWLFSRWGRK